MSQQDDSDPRFGYGFNLEDVTCGACGGTFAVESDWLANKKRTGHKFYCPYCCRQIWYTVPPKPAPALIPPDEPWWKFW